MMQLWYDDMIRFMRDASEYGTYNADLAKIIAPWLSNEMHICDAGCGLGYLSLALSPYVKNVSSVEINPNALAVLKDNCRSLGINNITPLCGSIQEIYPETKYDAMVFCFFGGIDEILEITKEQCCGDIFIITRTYTTHRFSVGKHPTNGYGWAGARETLSINAIPFEEMTFELEFGQPFRSMADAKRFFEIYSKDEDKSFITDEFLLNKVKSINHQIFSLYMPHLRNLGILRFKAADIPDNIQFLNKIS